MTLKTNSVCTFWRYIYMHPWFQMDQTDSTDFNFVYFVQQKKGKAANLREGEFR